MTIIKEFKQFLLRGNVIDLAIAVVIGSAFGAVVSSLVKGIFTPLISAIFGNPDFSKLSFTINGSVFMYGEFLNALISFIIIALVVFFFIIKPMNLLISRFKKGEVADPTTKKCGECLSDIPLSAKRCSHCTQLV